MNAPKTRSHVNHLQVVSRRGSVRALTMSHLQALRGSFARHILKEIKFNQVKKGSKKLSQIAGGIGGSQHLKGLSTIPKPAVDNGIINSTWEDIQIGNETLQEYIFRDAGDYADETALTCGSSGRSYNYGMLHMLIERCACAFLGELRLQPGDRVGIILPNIPEFAVVIHGAMRAGLVATFANPLYTADEIKRQFTDCDVQSIVTIEMFMPVAQEVSKFLPGYKGTIWVGGEGDKTQGIYGLKSLLMADHAVDIPSVDVDSVGLIPYSSGTTGMPKGVMLTHKSLVCNLKQVSCPSKMKYDGEKGHHDVMLTVPPFFHIYGFNGVLNYNLSLGFHTVTMPRFTPEEYIKCLVEYQPSTLFVVPSLLAFMATHPAVKKEHLQSVETIMVGAAPTTDSMLEKFLLKCEKTKDDIRLLQGYGMTESSPVTLMTPYHYPHGKVGSVGQLISSTQARLVSLSTGELLGPHKSGELLLRGPQVMKGYWKRDDATKETLDSDGWLHTGDVAYYDEDHYFYVVDRTKELIKVKGNQVSPTEIETIIGELPQVADVAVVGMPDALAGEVPKAFVVLKEGQTLSEKDVTGIVADKLTKYKHLAGGVSFLKAIPRNAAGKIMRNELKVLGR